MLDEWRKLNFLFCIVKRYEVIWNVNTFLNVSEN